ncbi:MAG: hypothetical protein R2725_05990 [Solirubrobacterales bacterium]
MSARQDLYEQTWGYLARFFPSESTQAANGRELHVTRGYMFALQPEDFVEDRALLTFYAVVSDPDDKFHVDRELLAWVNKLNGELWLGSLRLENDMFVYTFRTPGECINEESIQILIRGFASLAAKLANEVKAEFEF